MCGRTVLSLNKEKVLCACSYLDKRSNEYTKPDWIHEHNDGKEFIPSYNIAPTDITPVLISGNKYKNASRTDRVLKPMMWGVIPEWHKDNYKSHGLSTNNCRLENIKASKLYGPLLKTGGRCVIIAEGFYEWQTTNKSGKVKQPYYIYAPQDKDVLIDDESTWKNSYTNGNGWKGIKLLYMAGLYSVWQDNGIIIYSYSVITMESNETLNWLHHRMPAILDTEEQISAWLDIDNVNPDLALSYLKPIQTISWHAVSTLVNNSRNKSPECNKRIIEKKPQKSITAFFTKTEKRKSTDEHSSASSNKKIKN